MRVKVEIDCNGPNGGWTCPSSSKAETTCEATEAEGGGGMRLGAPALPLGWEFKTYFGLMCPECAAKGGTQ
jgi:hypothetical protein